MELDNSDDLLSAWTSTTWFSYQDKDSFGRCLTVELVLYNGL